MGGDLGLLLSLPTDSIAVRAVLASLVAVLLGRLLLRSGWLRSPRVRLVAALLPAVSLGVVLLSFASSPSLPGLWLPADAVDGLAVPVADRYLSFVPVAASLLVLAWASVVVARLALRWSRAHRVGRGVRRAVDEAGPTPSSVTALVARLAAAFEVPTPAVAVVDRLPGGAMVLGVRHPVLAVDARLLAALDDEELEGVLAHELAHLHHHDNLVAAALGVVRDMFFFVPGGGWSLARLLREREHAADAAASSVTGRPGALASGLLKVLEGARADESACAALMPEGTLVDRVKSLCDDRPVAGRGRTAGEALVTGAAVLLAVAAAVQVPGLVAGSQGQRDALGVLVSDVGESGTTGGAPAVFRVYADTSLSSSTSISDTSTRAPAPVPALVDDPNSWTPQRLEACAAGAGSCIRARPAPSLGLVPAEVVTVDDERVARWRLDPVMSTTTREVALFWLTRAQ